MATDAAAGFPCALTLDVPFPDARLASVALQALRVDKELSSLVKRHLSTIAPEGSSDPTLLRVEYTAATNRMLRVAVNSFLESVYLVLEVQEELDVDVVEARQSQEKSA
ncbi:hypothetical protein N0V88_006453 [Collariella sp. IMI 366227]|nr:hypothetical protein N0V88_006453 [Collariella sp. IMI 366227]